MNTANKYPSIGFFAVLLVTMTAGCSVLQPKSKKSTAKDSTAKTQPGEAPGTAKNPPAATPPQVKDTPAVTPPQGGPIALQASLVVAADLTLSSGYAFNGQTQSSLIDALNMDSSFYNNQPHAAGAPTTTDPSQHCYEIGDITIEANKNTVKIFRSADISDCIKTSQVGQGIQIMSLKETFSYSVYLTCTSKDLSYLNGKKFGELSGEAENEDLQRYFGCTNGTKLMQMLDQIEKTSVLDGVTTVENMRDLSHSGAKGFQPCAFSVSGSTDIQGDDCVDFHKNEIYQKETSNASGSIESKTGDISLYTYSGVTDDHSPTAAVWHKSGKIGVSYNGWTGTVTYNGSNTAPSFSMSEKGTSMPIIGVLTATTAE